MRELVAGHKTAALALAGFEAFGEEMELAKFLTEVYWVRRDQANYKTAALALALFETSGYCVFWQGPDLSRPLPRRILDLHR